VGVGPKEVDLESPNGFPPAGCDGFPLPNPANGSLAAGFAGGVPKSNGLAAAGGNGLVGAGGVGAAGALPALSLAAAAKVVWHLGQRTVLPIAVSGTRSA